MIVACVCERSSSTGGSAPAPSQKKSSWPVCWMSRKSAMANVASPKAFMMNAFLPAWTALVRWCQKLISR